jgi:hypothetical protein
MSFSLGATNQPTSKEGLIMTRNSYYPARIGDQALWLSNLRNKIANYQAALGYTAGDITTLQADADYCIYLLGTWLPAVRRFGESATAYLEQILNGSGTMATLPTFALPAAPPPPAAVMPGALRRIFVFIKNLKTRSGYSEAIGEDLGIIGSESDENEAPPRPPKAQRAAAKSSSPSRKWATSASGSKARSATPAIGASSPSTRAIPTTTPARSKSRANPRNAATASASGTATRATSGATSSKSPSAARPRRRT